MTPLKAALVQGISIHAPRTGSDPRRKPSCSCCTRISIHAPRTGSDERLMCAPIYCETFQSTLPARGATVRRCVCGRRLDISIHAPRTGSDAPESALMALVERLFQSTLPARGATLPSGWRNSPYNEFQSTLPARGATSGDTTMRVSKYISIHAPRTGSDRRRPMVIHPDAISIHAPRTGSDSCGRFTSGK